MTLTPPSPSVGEPLIQPLCAIFRRFLKHQGLKFTTERAQILDAVLAREGVFEADELWSQLRRAGHRVSKATIYRTLRHLVEAKIVSEVLLDSKQTHYEMSFGRQPKVYLVCVNTHQIIEVDDPQLIQIRDRICADHDFQPLTHRFIIYGISSQDAPLSPRAEPTVELPTSRPNSRPSKRK